MDFEGEKKIWRSGVQIKKCRYLEQSGCVGMCINMCKVLLDSWIQLRPASCPQDEQPSLSKVTETCTLPSLMPGTLCASRGLALRSKRLSHS